MTIRVTIWNENEHEKTNALVARLYPQGIHGAISKAFDGAKDISFEMVTQDMPEHGLTVARLKNTDVLIWWGHKIHGDVSDEIVDRVQQRVWEGMGLIVLHSGHHHHACQRRCERLQQPVPDQLQQPGWLDHPVDAADQQGQ